MKVKKVDMGGGLAPTWRHWCPGCKMNHVIYTDPRAQPNGHHWTFDGNVDELLGLDGQAEQLHAGAVDGQVGVKGHGAKD